MDSFELITSSKAVADMAWDAVKVSNPAKANPGGYRHEDVTEGDHQYAIQVLSREISVREYRGAWINNHLISTAHDLVTFIQSQTGWATNTVVYSEKNDVELGVASMIQYQNRIREQLKPSTPNDRNDRMEVGLEKLLLNFTGTYPLVHSESIIQTVRERLDPIFETGLRLSDYQPAAGKIVTSNPQMEDLAKQIIEGQLRGQTARQEPQTVAEQPTPPTTNDPWSAMR